ncbi:hypothetical protein GSI_13046 [Ganoderma sinense ZZ0214-1]|uniref:Nucleoside 2-deoxyribosyltransferase n=1 Tax=Ganoderma sinense ZZ0214-1 TaxID=1077348 RepID=A0A2G8RUG8_9APHY|nr:hypothetical protein GSI_13046 [Ganoderma sinense ZZ0214-1]
MADSKSQPPSTDSTQSPPEKEFPPPIMVGQAAAYIAPAKVPAKTPGRSVFLAGSIEMGKADNWQPRMTESLKDITCTVFNPRRLDWNSDWVQRKSNPKFFEQVKWELDLLEKADVIAMYFDPETKSPITLFELGLHLKAKDELGRPKLLVGCPDGFYRLGNVEIVCEEKDVKIPIFGSYEKLVAEVRERLQHFDVIKKYPEPENQENQKGKKGKEDRKDSENMESEKNEEGEKETEEAESSSAPQANVGSVGSGEENKPKFEALAPSGGDAVSS